MMSMTREKQIRFDVERFMNHWNLTFVEAVEETALAYPLSHYEIDLLFSENGIEQPDGFSTKFGRDPESCSEDELISC